jgi:hypothetical protein
VDEKGTDTGQLALYPNHSRNIGRKYLSGGGTGLDITNQMLELTSK